MFHRGSLPPPKRKSLNDLSDDENVDDSAQPLKKRMRRSAEKVLEDEVPEKIESGQSGGIQEEGVEAAPIAQPKFSRYEGLITGPGSKASWMSVRKKEVKVPKAHLGRLAGMLDLPVEVFCEVWGLHLDANEV